MPGDATRKMDKGMQAEIIGVAQATIAGHLYDDAGKPLDGSQPTPGKETTEQLLRRLGDEIARSCGCTPVYGPIKSFERANEKRQKEYKGDWYEVKDLVRMTIVAPTFGHLDRVKNMLRDECVARHGLGLIKDVEVFAHTDECGYSGLNFVVRMTNGRPAEIQSNVPGIMYGKMSKADFVGAFGQVMFEEMQRNYKIEGGLGHTLYEVQRADPSGVNGQKAAQLSKQYYDYLRKGFYHPQVCQQLARELMAFKLANPTFWPECVPTRARR
jgi:hypothetical protein